MDDSKTIHRFGQKTGLNKFNKTEITLTISSDQNTMKPDIGRKVLKFTNIWGTWGA